MIDKSNWFVHCQMVVITAWLEIEFINYWQYALTAIPELRDDQKKYEVPFLDLLTKRDKLSHAKVLKALYLMGDNAERVAKQLKNGIKDNTLMKEMEAGFTEAIACFRDDNKEAIGWVNSLRNVSEVALKKLEISHAE